MSQIEAIYRRVKEIKVTVGGQVEFQSLLPFWLKHLHKEHVAKQRYSELSAEMWVVESLA